MPPDRDRRRRLRIERSMASVCTRWLRRSTCHVPGEVQTNSWPSVCPFSKWLFWQ